MNCPIPTCKPQECNAIDATLWMVRVHMNTVTQSKYSDKHGYPVFVCAGYGMQFEGHTELDAFSAMKRYLNDVYGINL